MALSALRRIQIGQESTKGTEVDADTTLIGTLSVTPSINWHRPMDERGSLAEYSRHVKASQSASLRYSGDASYDQILHFLTMLIETGARSVPASAAIARQWVYQPRITRTNTQLSYTFEYGDETNQWTIPYVMCSSIDLGIRLGEVVSLSADLFGRFPIRKSQTSGVTEDDVREVTASSCKFFLDNDWADVGDTQYDALIAGGSIRLASGLRPIRLADGSLEFSIESEGKRSHSIDLDVIMDDVGRAQIYDSWLNGTSRAMRLSFEEAADSIETGHRYSMYVDMYGRFTSDPSIFGDHEGQDTIRMTFMSEDNNGSTQATRTDLRVTVTNNVDAL